MADSIPICDVLSEAMEYMSKLGTNIRIRSENLREKRIRKDKLRNTHAIHKAVDKVLLICELSKKSIENVETGVKNLLLQMEKAGSSYGPGPETRDRSNDVNFEYFTYESRRLKIRNKISVGHYTSVKVVSTSMSLPVLEKYPVYHDCKLYRMRKRKKRREMQAYIMDTCTTITDLNQLENSEEHAIVAKEKTLDEIDKSNNTKISDPTPSVNEDANENTVISRNDNLQSENKEQCIEKELVKCDLDVKSCEVDKDDSDFEVKHHKKKHKKKFKHVKVIDDSSNSDQESMCSKEASSKKCRTPEKLRDDDENSEKSEGNSEKVRPMIKCVSLDKLLKPERVKNLDDDPKKCKKKDKSERRRERHSKSEAIREEKHKRSRRLDTSDEDEDEYAYWARKRKEVKKFKSKDFRINVNRLPKITPMLLESYNLTRITQNGSVLCEIVNETTASDRVNNDLEPKTKRMKICNSSENIDLDKVKSALLDDSDSDISEPHQNKSLPITERHDLHGHTDVEMTDVIKEKNNICDSSQENIDLATQHSDELNDPQKSRKLSDDILQGEVQNVKLTSSEDTDCRSNNNIQEVQKNHSIKSNFSNEIEKSASLESENNKIINTLKGNETEDTEDKTEDISTTDLNNSEGEVNSQLSGSDSETHKHNSKNVQNSEENENPVSESQVVSETPMKPQEELNENSDSDDEIIIKKKKRTETKTLKNSTIKESEFDVKKKQKDTKNAKMDEDESDSEKEIRGTSKNDTDKLQKTKKVCLDRKKNRFDKEKLENQTTNESPSKQDSEDSKQEHLETSENLPPEMQNGQEEDLKDNKSTHSESENSDSSMLNQDIIQKQLDTLNNYLGTDTEVQSSENEADKKSLSENKNHFLANRSGSGNEKRKQDVANSPKESDHITHFLEKQDDTDIFKKGLNEICDWELQNKKKKQKYPGNAKISSEEYNEKILDTPIESKEKPSDKTESPNDGTEIHELKNALTNKPECSAGNPESLIASECNVNKGKVKENNANPKKSRKTLLSKLDPVAEKDRTVDKEQEDVGKDKVQKAYQNQDKPQRSCFNIQGNCDKDAENEDEINADESKNSLINQSSCNADSQEGSEDIEKNTSKKTEKKIKANKNKIKKLSNESESHTNEKQKKENINSNSEVSKSDLNVSKDAKRRETKNQDKEKLEDNTKSFPIDSVDDNQVCNDSERNSETENPDEVHSDEAKESLLNETGTDDDKQKKYNKTERGPDMETGNQKELNAAEVQESHVNERNSDVDKPESCKDAERCTNNETENDDGINSEKVEESLMNESDSDVAKQKSWDNSEKKSDKETEEDVNSEKVKESLLNESVSDADSQESLSASQICNDSERSSGKEIVDSKENNDTERNTDKETVNLNKVNSEDVQKSTLNDSDSDNQEINKIEKIADKDVENQEDVNSEHVKKLLLNESDSDSDKQESNNTERFSDKETENQDEINPGDVKKSLLNESDSDSDIQAKSHTERVSDNETVKQDEANAEDVKKLLLNQSDSETENLEICNISDENLGKKSENRNEVNAEEIKKSLLNESDSDTDKQQECDSTKQHSTKGNEYQDEVSAEEVKKSLLNESDSDENNEDSCNVTNEHSDTETANKEEVNAEEIKKSLLNESESDENNHESCNINKENSDTETANKDEVNAEEIKKSLLNESDSDADKSCNNSEKKSVKDTGDNDDINTEEVKKSLLNESDSDVNKKESNNSKENPNKDNDNQDEVNADEVKKSLLNESDCDTNNQEQCNNTEKNSGNETEKQEEVKDLEESLLLRKRRSGSTKDTEVVKSSPLKESSDDRTKTPMKRKSFSGDSPPQSKRKHIMESMYAKRMLLTYSSSSDTEDEQLRNTLKEIKNYLLKGVSSDEDGANKAKKDSAKTSYRNSKRNQSKEDSSESDDLSPEKIIKSKAIKRENSDTDSSSKPTCGSISESSIMKKMGRSRATRAGSCSQNSDMLDDKEIDGLTNLKSLKKAQRRRDSSTDNTQSTRSGRRLRMAKAGGVISSEGFLQAESSSDAASLSGSDHGDHADAADLEEMPRVKLSDINGDGIVGHLAKDDLLGESDTSISHDEKRDSKRSDDTDDDHQGVKSKRRKGHAISSDSEAGSSRRKDHIRLSDFEDSEDESSEPVKSKRKKKGSDSDASVTSGDGKKKRRRIKTLDDSDVSGSDTENEGRNKHGRKNIRKVMSKNQLEEATKKAAREEKERIARIAERQKLYNNLEFDESGKPDEVVLEKVVLDFDPETKEPLIQVDRGLVKKLKPHQANGIKFMWDACFESVKRIKKDRGSGCILAHCMGLGKTLQVVSLTHTLLTHGTLTGVNRVLVVCPLSTVLNWVNEFRMWLKHAEADFEVDVYELSKFKQNSERAFQLSQWFEHGGVCVLGYEMFRNLSADNNKKFKKKMLKNFQESLVDPGPDLVVCDEGHLLKNEKTSLSQSMNRVKTRRRIVLTGTPLQNNLKEYYCMVQFVKPNLLGKYNEYLNRFVNPITNGQYTDSTEHDIRVMKRRSHVLHKMLDGAVQRRDYGVLAPFLPPKHEYVLFITLTDVQIKLYQHYLDNYSRQPLPGKSSGFLFPDFQSLQRIWTHPLVLKYNSERYEIMQQKKREREEEEESEGSLLDFINDDSTPDESSTEESSDDLSDLSDDSRKKSKKKKSAKKGKSKDSKVTARRGTRANPIEGDEEEPIESLEVKNENPTEWWMKLVSEDELEDMRNSSKLVLLFDILRQCEAIGDKLLVFSQSLYSLDLIEHFLGKVDDATQEGRVDEKLGGHVGSWSPGVDYFRLDGSTSCENRSIWCKNFNREDNPRARLFLISTRAGGLGINLVAANRVVIFDVSWNPSHDVQSIFRVYRFGQKKPCYIYRFLAMGTMEEKIYERQVTKQAISKRVIDEQQIDRHYAENDLAELYKFEPQPPVPRPLPPLPKDRLFAEMLREHEAQIYKYHEHDSLLENKEEETLSEEERKAAWEDFENEKTRPPPQPLLSPYAMHNGMMPGLIAQQQQLMYAAVAAMVRKDMPNMNDQQIRDAVSLIYNANANPAMYGGYDYGAMQKMGDMYKYAQPMPGMNPGMMNAMNAAGAVSGAGGMGMGGASGLQYEPPWQRQQQHQQQMRLQQIMQQQQQQNSMGAKYYAGGLGSRDPMAMALQQQRARELMLRPRARGRPPLGAPAPRPPPAHAALAAPSAGDVVNLDSD